MIEYFIVLVIVLISLYFSARSIYRSLTSNKCESCSFDDSRISGEDIPDCKCTNKE